MVIVLSGLLEKSILQHLSSPELPIGFLVLIFRRVCQVSSCGMLCGLHQRMGSEKEKEWFAKFAVELR